MIITISGLPGSGKSTLAKNLAKELRLRHYGAGDLLREIAREKGMTLLQIHEKMVRDREFDDLLDQRTERFGKEKNDFVIDGRVAWHFIPKSIKIFVTIDLRTAAERVFKDMRSDEKENNSAEQTMRNMRRRTEMNRVRYKKLYGIDYLDKKNYDIIIDTTKIGIKEMTEKALKEITKAVLKREKDKKREMAERQRRKL